MIINTLLFTSWQDSGNDNLKKMEAILEVFVSLTCYCLCFLSIFL